MPRQSVVKIRTEIVIPYERQTFGAAAEAERVATKIKEAIGDAMNGTDAISRKWSAEHATEEATPPAPPPKVAAR